MARRRASPTMACGPSGRRTDRAWRYHVGSPAGIADLYVKPLMGRDGEEQLLLKTGENKFICDWSPDGRYLVYGSISPTTKSTCGCCRSPAINDPSLTS